MIIHHTIILSERLSSIDEFLFQYVVVYLLTHTSLQVYSQKAIPRGSWDKLHKYYEREWYETSKFNVDAV